MKISKIEQNRIAIVSFRLSPDELFLLDNYIQPGKIKRSAYIRNLILSDIIDEK
jgi:hypothetical protein